MDTNSIRRLLQCQRPVEILIEPRQPCSKRTSSSISPKVWFLKPKSIVLTHSNNSFPKRATNTEKYTPSQPRLSIVDASLSEQLTASINLATRLGRVGFLTLLYRKSIDYPTSSKPR